MNKMLRNIIKIMPVLTAIMLVVTVISPALAVNVVQPSGTPIAGVDDAMKSVWGTFAAVVQVLAVVAVVLMGIRYMFAGADKKADIKSQTVAVVVGAILVFLAVPVMNFVVNAAKTIFK